MHPGRAAGRLRGKHTRLVLRCCAVRAFRALRKAVEIIEGVEKDRQRRRGGRPTASQFMVGEDGRLHEVLDTEGNVASNAMARCDVHQVADDRAACQARIMGMGNTEGSVAGGGLIREVETVTMPQGVSAVTAEPQTSDPIVLTR